MCSQNIEKGEKASEIISLIYEGLLIGVISGVSVTVYRKMLEYIESFRGGLFSFNSVPTFFLLLLIVIICTLFIAALIKFEPKASGSGVPVVLAEVNGETQMNSIRVTISKFLGGAFSNLSGLSLGLEGPSIQIGGAMAKLIPSLPKVSKLDSIWRVTAGASAGVSAAFSAPLTGIFFALEEMHGFFSPRLIVPCMIASSVADFISVKIFGLSPMFSFQIKQSFPLNSYLILIFFGVFVGVIGVVFNKLSIGFSDVLQKYLPKKTLQILLVTLTTLTIGVFFYPLLGGGHHLLEFIAGKPYTVTLLAILLLMKIFLTTLASASGAHGGIFIPILCIGGLAGAFFNLFFASKGLMLDMYYVNFILFGMVGIVSSVVRSPLMAVIMVTEITGSFNHLLGFVLVSIMAYITAEAMKNPPLYSSLLERSGYSAKH